MPQITNIKHFIDKDKVNGEMVKGYINSGKFMVRDINENPLPAFGNKPLTVDDLEVLIFELSIIKRELKQAGDNREATK